MVYISFESSCTLLLKLNHVSGTGASFCGVLRNPVFRSLAVGGCLVVSLCSGEEKKEGREVK